MYSRALQSVKNQKINFSFIDKIPKEVKKEIKKIKNEVNKIPLVIDGEEIYNTERKKVQRIPYQHNHVISEYCLSNKYNINKAIEASIRSKKTWDNISTEKKYEIFLKAADLISGKYYNKLLAATIVGQGKNIYQAEIDAICELADFLRFNVKYHSELSNEHPLDSNEVINKSKWIGLNGFVASITPFNFTAIGGNLATAPLLMNNPVIWKPSDYSILSNYYIYQIMVEAGMPENMIQFIPSEPNLFLEECLNSNVFSGLAFTGSSNIFNSILKKSYQNIDKYKSYPRIVGETGGNNYHFVFPDCEDNDMLELIVKSTIRGAFEYSGQKCSATSRLYIPRKLYNDFKYLFRKEMSKLKIGSPEKDYNFTSSVIHVNSFDKCRNWINENYDNLIYGGNCDDTKGFYIEPTVIKFEEVDNPRLKKEIFGPILSLVVYDENELDNALSSCVNHTKYKLTGSIFTQSQKYMPLINKYVKSSVGNLYINDKSTGSVVGQQPFGGFGKSGTNDKAGSKYFLTRFGNNVITKYNMNFTSKELFNEINN